MFRTYSEDVKFNYLKSFGRVSVTYPSPEQAELAQSNLNNLEFQGASLKMRPVKVKFHSNICGFWTWFSVAKKVCYSDQVITCTTYVYENRWWKAYVCFSVRLIHTNAQEWMGKPCRYKCACTCSSYLYCKSHLSLVPRPSSNSFLLQCWRGSGDETSHIIWPSICCTAVPNLPVRGHVRHWQSNGVSMDTMATLVWVNLVPRPRPVFVLQWDKIWEWPGSESYGCTFYEFV